MRWREGGVVAIRNSILVLSLGLLAACGSSGVRTSPDDEGAGGMGGGSPYVRPTCDDGEKNGDETDVDCGGPCGACEEGRACDTDSDCTTSSCVEGVCAAPRCDDGRENGDETDVDCGGGTCPRCPVGKMCRSTGDCETNTCMSGICEEPSSCLTGVMATHWLLVGAGLLVMRSRRQS